MKLFGSTYWCELDFLSARVHAEGAVRSQGREPRMRPYLFEEYGLRSTYTLCEIALCLSWEDKVLCCSDSVACGSGHNRWNWLGWSRHIDVSQNRETSLERGRCVLGVLLLFFVAFVWIFLVGGFCRGWGFLLCFFFLLFKLRECIKR